ncbi:MAG: hypothetical protein ABI416_19605 [Ginsengibacter sp.]
MPPLLFFFNSYSFAQNNNSDTTGSTLAVADEDSTGDDYENSADTLIIKTVFDDANDSIVKWKRAREFGYMAYLDSLLRKKTDLRIDTVNIDKGTLNKPRATAFLTRNNSDSFLNNFGVRIFFWIIALFFIGFIVYKLFFTGGLFASRNTKAEEEPTGREPEALNEYSAYNLLIHEAESKNDLNLAVRYLYLQSLKRLADHELIIFSPDKTNNLYLQEMAANSHLKEFSFLTLNYEYTWYGRFAIDMTKYHDLKEKFISFNKKI